MEIGTFIRLKNYLKKMLDSL